MMARFSYLILLKSVIVVSAHDGNPALHRYVVVSRRNILIVFSGNYGYFLILHQNLTNENS